MMVKLFNRPARVRGEVKPRRGLIISHDTKRKLGSLPNNRVGVYDARNNLRGHVAKTSTASTAARILGGAPAEFRDGEWHQKSGRQS